MNITLPIMLIVLTAAGVLSADPSDTNITDAQKSILNSTEDFTPAIDTPALHLLLESAAPIEQLHIETVISDPSSHRGRSVMITGKLARIREMTLARAIKTGKPVEEWSILTDNGKVILVYTPQVEKIAIGNKISLQARFYKIWRDKNQAGQQQDYPVFVATGAFRVMPALANNPPDTPGLTSGVIILASVVVLWIVFRRVRAINTASRPKRITRKNAPAADVVEEHVGNNPADALEAMDQRNQEISDTDKDTK